MEFIENFSFDRFVYSLQYMWQGMLSIFLVIGIIVGFVVILNLLTNRKPKMKKEKQ